MKLGTLLLMIPLTLGFSTSALGMEENPSARGASAAAQEQTVIHLKSGTNDLHAAVMALKVGVALLTTGNKVVIFADLEGVRLFDKKQPISLSWGTGGVRLESLYESFVDKGGTVLLCPHCAEEMGLTRGELRTGVEIGDMETIAELIGRASKVIDY